MKLLDQITEFHRLYARYKRPEYLEIAANLGKVKESPSFEEIWAQKVNEGYDREGIPHLYTPDGQKLIKPVLK